MKEIILVVPRPPSVNRSYGNRKTGQKGRGRYISPELHKWRMTACRNIQATGVPDTYYSPVSIEIWVSEEGLDKRHRDADNFTKQILDLLVSLNILQDDSREYVRSVKSSWSQGESGTVKVVITPEKGSLPDKYKKRKSWAMKQLKRKFGIDISADRIHVQ